MNWTEAVDGYCERLDASFWAEPVNAVTNGAFLLAALFMWRRSVGVPEARFLCAVLFAIGVGSFLFHTFAQPWAGVADVLPIAVFVFAYIFLAARDYLGMRRRWAGVATLGFVPFAAVTVPLFAQLPILGVSAGYWPVCLLIALFAIVLRRKLPDVALGLGVGAAILTVSITLRSLDMPLCAAIPIGTHLWWHILNGIMLGWMIEVYRRFRVKGGLASARAPY